MEKWIVEFTIEKVNGDVRFESFECDNVVGVQRLVNVFKVRNGEHLIHVDGRLVKTLF